MKKKLLAMIAKKNELKENAKGIMDTALAENRTITDEERTTINDLKVQIANWDQTIADFTGMMEDGEGVPTSTPMHQGTANDNNEERFMNFGQQLAAVCSAAQPANRNSIDQRLLNAASGANSSTGSDGGFLIQEDFVTELLNNTYNTGILASRVRRIPLSAASNTLKLNTVDETSRVNGSRWGGVQAFWETEAELLTGSKPKFKQLTLALKKLTGLCYATDELLEDASALQSVTQTAFSEEFGFKIDDAVLRGSGVGEPLGILNSPALVTVAKEADQTLKLTVENIVKMVARCVDKQNKAEWYLNRELLPALVTLKLGDTPIYIPGGSLANAPYGTLMGKPINFIEQASAAGTVGDIILADMSEYLMIDRSGINANSSIHVRFLYDETAFRFIYRADGQPAWNSARTPYKGSDTVSPFVALAAR